MLENQKMSQEHGDEISSLQHPAFPLRVSCCKPTRPCPQETTHYLAWSPSWMLGQGELITRSGVGNSKMEMSGSARSTTAAMGQGAHASLAARVATGRPSGPYVLCIFYFFMIFPSPQKRESQFKAGIESC
jgi:hypothetical protein